MMTFMEVKGHQRSNVVNCYGDHIWSKEPLMQAKNDDNLQGVQRSSEVKCKLCAMATIFGHRTADASKDLRGNPKPRVSPDRTGPD